MHRIFYTEALTQGSFCTEMLLHTNAFTHKCSCTEALLHRPAFTHRRFYVQQLLHTTLCADQPLRKALLHTKAFTQKHLYTEASTHRIFFYTEKLFHRNCFTEQLFTKKLLYTKACHTQEPFQRKVFTHRNLYTERKVFSTKKPLQPAAFPHRSFYTEMPLHREAVAQSNLYALYTSLFFTKKFFTQKLLRFTQRGFCAGVFTHKSFYTEKLLHREAVTQSSFSTKSLSIIRGSAQLPQTLSRQTNSILLGPIKTKNPRRKRSAQQAKAINSSTLATHLLLPKQPTTHYPLHSTPTNCDYYHHCYQLTVAKNAKNATVAKKITVAKNTSEPLQKKTPLLPKKTGNCCKTHR